MADEQPQDVPPPSAESEDSGEGSTEGAQTEGVSQEELDAEAATAAALAAAQEAVATLDDAANESAPSDASPLNLPSLDAGASADLPEGLSLLSDVRLNVTIELGRTRMLVEDVLKLGDGAVVELDKLAGDPVDIYVNERLVARGEVLVLNDNFCVRVSEILASLNMLNGGSNGTSGSSG